jgi:hypothetical protein
MSVVKAAVRDFKGMPLAAADEAMLPVDPARPMAREIALERLGLSFAERTAMSWHRGRSPLS